MEDQQKTQNQEQTTRRRRAVRSVPMGNPNGVTAAPNAESNVPQEPARADAEQLPQNEVPVKETASIPPPAELPKQPAPSAPIPQTAAVPQEPKAAEPVKPEPAKPEAVKPEPVKPEPVKPEPVKKPSSADDAFSVERTFSAKPQKKHAGHLPFGAVAVMIAVLAVICAVTLLPFMTTTEAVMLYVDDTAIGYLAHEDTASAQMERVREDLRSHEMLDTYATLYRCEHEQIRGDVTYLSADDVYDALFAQATDGYVRAYRLIGDVSSEDGNGDAVGAVTEAEILTAVGRAEDILRERYTAVLPTGTTLSVVPNISWESAWISESALMDADALTAAMIAMQDTPYPMFSVTASMTETAAERIPYETTLVPNDENFDGIRTMISPGADGLAQVSYRISYDPETGAELSREETARVVVREPVSAVSYEGLYPLPDGVSTGTFDWPLPPLPDDELPLDENGNPYMPENPLALKNTYVSSGYGGRDLWGAYDFHLGLDIVAPAYTEIYAADGGVVVYAAYTSSYGYMTRIRHANNVETVYAHQIKQVVKPGDVVQKGQLIGYVGSTGNTSGNHLHLEFRRDHVTVDPLEYIAIPEEILVLGEGY